MNSSWFIAYLYPFTLYTSYTITNNCNNRKKMAFMRFSFILTELKTASTDLSFRKCKSCYLCLPLCRVLDPTSRLTRAYVAWAPSVTKSWRLVHIWSSNACSFTFMHLADAFIQSDLQYIQVIHVFLSVYVFPGHWTHKYLCFCLEYMMQLSTDVFHVDRQGGPARCSNVVVGAMFYLFHPGCLVGKTCFFCFSTSGFSSFSL